MVLQFLSNARHVLSDAEWSVFASLYLSNKEMPELQEGSAEENERQRILRKLRGGTANADGRI